MRDRRAAPAAHAAACRIQAIVRRFAARVALGDLMMETFVRLYDHESRMEYYLNQKTWESSWEPPALLPSWVKLLAFDENQDLDRAYEESKSQIRTGRTSRSSESKETDRAMDLRRYVLKEPEKAPRPATNEAICTAWRTILSKDVNAFDACPIRIDVWVSSQPQRCLVLHTSNLQGFLAREGLVNEQYTSEWKWYMSFFAFSAPVQNTTKYSVWSRSKPFRSKLKMEIEELPDSLQVDEEGWKKTFAFWAFYAPVQNSFRINVQKVPNPVRFRVTEDQAERGGWSQSFCFFAYPVVRLAVLDAVHCGRANQHYMRGKIEEFGFNKADVLNPAIKAAEQEDDPADLSGSLWCRRFCFVALKCRFPGTTRYQVCRKYEYLSNEPNPPKVHELPAYLQHQYTLHPVYKLVQENTGDTKGWEIVSEFYAYPLPMPGTTKYYFMYTRRPRRFRVSLSDCLGNGWKTLFAFYAYSTRPIDTYFWRKMGPGDTDWAARSEDQVWTQEAKTTCT